MLATRFENLISTSSHPPHSTFTTLHKLESANIYRVLPVGSDEASCEGNVPQHQCDTEKTSQTLEDPDPFFKCFSPSSSSSEGTQDRG